MSTYTTLVATPPAAGGGCPIGLGTWRFEVDIATPAFGQIGGLGSMVLGDPLATGPDSSVLGTMKLGNRLSTTTWHDVTGHVQGVEWNRGGDPEDRPEVGEITIRLNNDHRLWSPFRSSYYGPGTLVRVVVHDPTTGEWWPQFTGLAGSWQDDSDGVGASRWVDVTAFEVMYLFGQINDAALVVPIGPETAAGRMLELVASLDINFTVDLDPVPDALVLQPTVMAQNRLSEMYLTADSVDGLLFSTKRGGLALISKARYGVGSGVVGVDPDHMGGGVARLVAIPTGAPGGFDIEYVADSLKTRNDDALLLAEVTLSEAGGTEVTYTQPASVRRHVKRTTSRNDLIIDDPAHLHVGLEFIAGNMLARGSQTYRPARVELNIGHGLAVLLFLIDADVGRVCDLDDGSVYFAHYSVARTTHRVTPLHEEAVLWECDVDLGVETNSEWSVT